MVRGVCTGRAARVHTSLKIISVSESFAANGRHGQLPPVYTILYFLDALPGFQYSTRALRTFGGPRLKRQLYVRLIERKNSKNLRALATTRFHYTDYTPALRISVKRPTTTESISSVERYF